MRSISTCRSRGAAGVVAAFVSAGLLLGCGTGDSTAIQAPASSTTSGSRLLSPAEFKGFLAENSEVPLVNVHIPYEGHIRGTDEFVPFEKIGEWSGLPEDKSAPIAVYCRSGHMSSQSAAELAEMGYTDVVDLDGGMKAWAAAGMTVDEDEPTESLDGAELNG